MRIRLKSTYFTKLFGEIVDFLQTPIDLGVEAELSVGIAKITAKTKESPQLRRRLRDYLEPRTANILQSINQELLERAIKELKTRGKKDWWLLLITWIELQFDLYHRGDRCQNTYLFSVVNSYVN